jgi:hypothetical protein
MILEMKFRKKRLVKKRREATGEDFGSECL